MNHKILSLFSISLLIFTSCADNKFEVDVSGVEVELRINRFDKELYAVNPEELLKEVPKLETKYPVFFPVYTENVLQIGTSKMRDFFFKLNDFLTHPDMREVYKTVEEEFEDISEIEKELTQAFRHYKYYYPEKEIPNVYTCMSGLNYGVFTSENILGIGLDLYLGKDSKYYEMAGFANYQRYNLEKYRIVPDCMQAVVLTDFQYNDSINNLMTKMVYNGKIQYLLHALMPNQPDSVLFGYTPVQLKWAYSYEDKVWAYILEQKHLFSNESLMIKKYTEPAPFTSYFKDSAPRIGVFIGYRIVEAFMENQPEVSLPELMKISDYNYILSNSGYNP